MPEEAKSKVGFFKAHKSSGFLVRWVIKSILKIILLRPEKIQLAPSAEKIQLAPSAAKWVESRVQLPESGCQPALALSCAPCKGGYCPKV